MDCRLSHRPGRLGPLQVAVQARALRLEPGDLLFQALPLPPPGLLLGAAPFGVTALPADEDDPELSAAARAATAGGVSATKSMFGSRDSRVRFP